MGAQCAWRSAIGAFLLLVVAGKADKSLPTPYRQFSARIETTAHQLNATSEYPPYKRYVTVYYDYEARRARIDYDSVPHMPPKSFVRRYDLGFEWMAMEVRATKECQKSIVREAMPMPRYPEHLIYVGQARVRGTACEHWRQDHGDETVELFLSADGHVPVRITTEAVESHMPTRKASALMTYDVYQFEAGPPNEDVFKMAASSSASIFSDQSPLAIGECERVVQDMGFPYIHFLHTYYYA